MEPIIISGSNYHDDRGILKYNNDFDTSQIKRIYIIEHKSISFERGWQGHKIEQRWFSALRGSFKISLIAVDNWITPSNDIKPIEYILKESKFNVLHVPAGYITNIQAIEKSSKLIVMSDYFINEINDEYRFPLNYFKQN
jgi:hypothetical protein